MKFTSPPNKDYLKDIKILHNALMNRETISFSKFCDGEWSVICNHAINNKEFWFDPNKQEDQIKRRSLLDAFQYKNDRYFVGVTCVNVFGLDTHRSMVSLSQQDQDHLTWADIWVNANYTYYLQNILPIYQTYNVVLFANKNAKVDYLPFKPYMFVPVNNNAWEHDWKSIDSYVEMADKINNGLFLFCCGPFGNILCHKLTISNPNNTYLDIGSTLNPFLQSAGFERDYYMNDNYFSRMIGRWDQ